MLKLAKNRWLIVAILHYLALHLFSQLNHYLSPWTLNISILGMLVAFSAFMLNFKQGLLSLIPVGLHLDSASPLDYGAFLAITLLLYCLLIFIRSQIHRESYAITATMALIGNAFVYIALTYSAFRVYGSNSIDLSQTALNFLASSLVITICTRFYFAIQLQTLEFFGIRILEEQREAR